MASKSEIKAMIAELKRTEGMMKKLYGDTYVDVLNIAAVRKAIEEGDDTFEFSKHKAALDSMHGKLTNLTKKTEGMLYNSMEHAWDKGLEDTEALITGMVASGKVEKEVAHDFSASARDEMRKRGATAGDWYNQKRGGVTLSQRVWNIAGDNARSEIEIIIQNGIKEGKDADEISRSVRPYLNEPNKLFRKVKNKETGMLEWSKAAKDYHPGQGVYRSAYKNAVRLIRTETNAAYRRAQWEEWQNNQLVTGFHIGLSNNHTTINSQGEPEPLKDICDKMVGDYPKSFQWTGWHPQCRCVMTPIVVQKDDFRERVRAIKEGKTAQWSPKDVVTKMPKGYNQWIKANKERIIDAKHKPFWIQDNYPDGDVTKKIQLINEQAALLAKLAEAKKAEEEAKKKAEEAKKKEEEERNKLYEANRKVEEEKDISDVERIIMSAKNYIPERLNYEEQTSHVYANDPIKELSTITHSSIDESFEMYYAVRCFSDGWDYEIRSVQRGENVVSKNGHSLDDIVKNANNLEEFIARSPMWAGGETYRGVALSDKELDGIRSSNVISMLGASSWSTSREIALDFADHYADEGRKNKVIFVASRHKRATSMMYVSVYDGEEEVVASKDCRYVIDSEYRVGNYIEIRLGVAK